MDKGKQIPKIRRQKTSNREHSFCFQLNNYTNLKTQLEKIQINKSLEDLLNAVSIAVINKLNTLLEYLSPNSASLKALCMLISDIENSKQPYDFEELLELAKNSGLKTTLNHLTRILKNIHPIIPNTKENPRKTGNNIVRQEFKGNFFKSCPCTPGAIHCGYKILTPAFGCKFNCSYCFLNFYQKQRESITLYNNTDKLIKELVNFAKNNPSMHRVGTGEFTDSFAINELNDINKQLLDILPSIPNIVLEFKSKSNNIDTFLNYPSPPKNAVLSWSINPQLIIDLEEDKTTSLKERLTLIEQASKKYYIGIHFDPIFMEDELLDIYLDTVKKVFSINPDRFVWVSLGGYRFTEDLKISTLKHNNGYKWYYGRFYEKSWDNKFRYPEQQRIKFYRLIAKEIKRYSNPAIYMCMESDKVWQKLEPELNIKVLAHMLDKFKEW